MSDYSEESCDDSDVDPDFEADSPSSESDDISIKGDASADESQSSTAKTKTRQKSKTSKSSPEAEKRSIFEGRSLSPSAVRGVNLSESDTSDEETFQPTKSPKDLGTSSYFTESSAPESQNTDYDFSQILALQNRLSQARENQEKEKQDDPKSKPSSINAFEYSISELLAIGEKNSSLTDNSGSESGTEESDNDKPEQKVVQITLDHPVKKSVRDKHKKRTSLLEKQLKLIQAENQLLLHKVNLLCLIAHGLHVNSVIINNDSIYGYLFSILPESYAPPQILSPAYVKKMLTWFGKKFEFDKNIPRTREISVEGLELTFENDSKNYSLKDLVVLFVSLLRGLGLTVRFVMSLQPVPLKPKVIVERKTTKKSDAGTKKGDEKHRKTAGKSEEAPVKKSPIKSASKASTSRATSTSNSKDNKKSLKSTSRATSTSNIEEDNKSLKSSRSKSGEAKLNTSPIKPSKNEATSSKISSKLKGSKLSSAQNVALKSNKDNKKNIQVLSPESENEISTDKQSQKSGIDYWLEVYIERDEEWISVDIFTLKVGCSQEIYARCTQPVAYVIAWNNDNTLKDVTRRYVPAWHVTSKKNRVDQDWFDKSIHSLRAPQSIFDKAEDQMLDHNESEMKAPIPTKISDLKNHPLYALKRHLLKFEAIYPSDAAPLGFVRGEPVYSRYCVHELFSREKWIRQGKCVKVGEEPYKIVKSRTKTDMFPGREKPLELFGLWQVADYIPPPVIDNKIPRNEYGNIEVYKPSMLPLGTVHLPRIQRIAKKMDIDCAPAVVGWEHHAGRSHPIIEGVVVCEEFKETLMDAWCEETGNSHQRSLHTRKQNVYKRWLKFVKHEIIKVHLKRKYNFGDPKAVDKGSPPKKSKNKSDKCD